jgi:hypothetical protein
MTILAYNEIGFNLGEFKKSAGAGERDKGTKENWEKPFFLNLLTVFGEPGSFCQNYRLYKPNVTFEGTACPSACAA